MKLRQLLTAAGGITCRSHRSKRGWGRPAAFKGPRRSTIRGVGPVNPDRQFGQTDKYARVERERRFLLASLPAGEPVWTRTIADRYLDGTRLRLRRIVEPASGRTEYKLTQKIPSGEAGPARGLITNIYLSRAEHDRLATLPAAVLTKTRHSLPPLGVDVFDPPRRGLIIGEAEFATDAAAEDFLPPMGVVAEVTADPRFTGGRLVRATRRELLACLRDYGISL
jgi:CYTH domain-containing protein